MAQFVAYGFYLHQKVSNMVLGFFPPYVYSAIPWVGSTAGSAGGSTVGTTAGNAGGIAV